MRKKIQVLSVVIALYSLLLITSFADTIKSEIINVEGTQVEVAYFIENGMQCEAMRILEQPKDLSKNLYQDFDIKAKSEMSRAEILNKAENILESRSKGNDIQSSSKLMASSIFWQSPQSFSITGYHPATTNVLVTSLGYFNATNITPFHIKLYDGYYKGIYSGSGVNAVVMVRELYEKTHASVAWSYPPAVTITTDTGSTMQIQTDKYSTLKVNRLPVEATSYISILSLKVTSESTVIVGNQAYPASVSIKKSVANFL